MYQGWKILNGPKKLRIFFTLDSGKQPFGKTTAGSLWDS
jgi:hypothetical protein